MTRLDRPKEMIDVPFSSYVNPEFRVKHREGESTYRTQRAGIRQGCPLSPYLFTCLMTVMFHDIHEDLDVKLGARHLGFFHWWKLVCAGDTMLIGNRARKINLLIAAIEKSSAKYNLKLNCDKCNYVGVNGKANIHFSNGKPMQEVSQATYLGGIICNAASRWKELNNRISKALVTCNRQKTFWYRTNCSYKGKLQVYNAIIIAQLTYGLSTVQLTPAMLKRLDAFQMRGLRHILKIEHSYPSRVSNQEGYDKINIIPNKGTDLEITWQELIAANRFDKSKKIKFLVQIWS